MTDICMLEAPAQKKTSPKRICESEIGLALRASHEQVRENGVGVPGWAGRSTAHMPLEGLTRPKAEATEALPLEDKTQDTLDAW